MLPRLLSLILICFFSAFVAKAQKQEKFIPFSKASYLFKPQGLHNHQSHYIQPASLLAMDTVPRVCICSVSPQIAAAGKQGNLWTYQGIPNASCVDGTITFASPQIHSADQTFAKQGPAYASPQPQDTCGVSNVTYTWTIVGGNEFAAISGTNTGSTVDIAISGNGEFTLNLVNTVTCSDSSSCSYYAYYTDTARVDSSRCTCMAGPVTIQPTNKQGNLWTYQGSVQGSCSGQYGTAPNLNDCAVQNSTYSWSILAPGGVASIVGATNGQTVDVQISGNGPFSLRLDGTTVCSDGQSCSNYNFIEDSARLDSPKSCSCSVDVDCERLADQGGLRRYNGVLKGGCTGEFGPTSPYQSCAIQNVVWSWSIDEGGDVVEIAGPANQQTVSVNIKGAGKYSLRVQADVTCNDGTTSCSSFDYCMDSVKKKECNISVVEDVNPIMDGGLKKWYKGPKIKRDEYIVLEAEGLDYDQVKFTCTPSADCNETGSNKTVLLTSRVKFKWSIVEGGGTIVEGGGRFVKLGCLPENKKEDEGEHVIFRPPVVSLPKKGDPPASVTTKIQLFIIDDNNTQPLDDTRIKNITVVTKRSFNAPDEYSIEVTNDPYQLPGIPSPGDKDGQCKAIRTWELDDNLKKPEIELPGVEDKDKMVVGEWIVLNVKDVRDPDKLKMVCDSKDCEDSGHEKTYEDNVEWKWDVVAVGKAKEKGKIIGDPKGRFIVYEAPEKLPDTVDLVEVKITAEVQNPDGLQIKDKPKEKGERILKIHRAGVKLEYPPLNWLPEENNSVSVKSFLVHRDGRQWKKALAHQCRIHFFEQMKVSNEKGVCLNDPVPDNADDCRDLYIKNEGGHEAFNDKKEGKKCELDNLFLEARTKKPEKEYSLTVHSRDFGSYGFLKSEATTMDKKPEYESVPVLKTDVTHPVAGRTKKEEYKDNRINIPRDIDENWIADGGWTVTGGGRVADPTDKKADNDNAPVGDGFRGDGFTTYEEYRGFRINSPGGTTHIRTNYNQKDLFIRNANSLPLPLFIAQSGLTVHQIEPDHYINDLTRVVNFNFNPETHLDDFEKGHIGQKGIFLRNNGNPACRPNDGGDLLGIADGPTCKPAPPNWITQVIVFIGEINDFGNRPRNWTPAQVNEKIAQVTAHELAHACNVYHHGECNPVSPCGFNAVNGLRSGNMNCIMRYDNIEPNVLETVGSIFCTNANATGANLNDPLPPAGRGFRGADPNLCRGNCIRQFRVSGRVVKIVGQNEPYLKRVTQNDCRRRYP